MKKKIIIILSILSIATIGFAQSITVTSPDSRDHWEQGSMHNLTWTKSGTMNSNVKIRLFNETGTTRILGIADSTDNNGTFRNWRIPDSIPAGRYVIRVKTIDNRVWDDSDVFEIGETTEPPGTLEITSPDYEAERMAPRHLRFIRIKYPKTDSTWKSGHNIKITWSKTGKQHDRIMIELYKERHLRTYMMISPNTENDGSFKWMIPQATPKGKYRIKITTLDRKIIVLSGIFNIKKGIPPLHR